MSEMNRMSGTARILRFDPAADKAPHYEEYALNYVPGMTALDVLNQIREEHDSSLAYDWCCRNGHCGVCGVRVNGRSQLLCRFPAEEKLCFEPLSGFPVIKDLIIDRSLYDAKKKELELFVKRPVPYDDQEKPEKIEPSSMERFKRVSRCIECLLCVSECPLCRDSSDGFAGPAAIIWEARFDADPRDEADRLPIFRKLKTDACLSCGACSKVCPHGVDPAGEILEIKKML